MKFIKILQHTARILVGALFVFSGFVKAVDPMGSAIKFDEYFEAFHWGFLSGFGLYLGILLAAAEFAMGLCLLLGVKMKTSAWAALLFMIFFTGLTFYSALASPVSDCGCFGDAVKLTNWQTFWKNVILLVPVIFIFISRKKYLPVFGCVSEWLWVVAAFAIPFAVSIYSYRHLPLLDFLPYNVGAHIPSKMIIPKGEPIDQYKTLYYYEKNGVVKEFTSDNYPWRDSTWKWKDTKNILIRKGYEPPIHDFSITSADGASYNDLVLTDTNYVFMLVTTDVSLIEQALYNKIQQLDTFCSSQAYNFMFVTSSAQSAVSEFQNKYHPQFNIYFADETMLKTMVRSNPGLMLIRQGVVLAKWHHNDFPALCQLQGNLLANQLNAAAHGLSYFRVLSMALLLALIVLLALYFRKTLS
jgi:uncharacterized membrane protein YphA (DoxX/SURF4 family)